MRSIFLKTVWIWTLFTGLFAADEVPATPAHPAMLQETAQVVELDLKGFKTGDLHTVIYLRGGTPYFGYIAAATALNEPRPIVAQPAGTHGLYDAATGKEITYFPSLFQRYGYKNKDWGECYKLWESGKIVARREKDPAPLTINATSIQGTFDVPSFGDATGEDGRCLRVQVQGSITNHVFSGIWEARSYKIDDRTYGSASTVLKGTMSGRLVSDHWDPKPGTEFAAGKNWPQTHGPNLNMSAIDCGKPMIEKIQDARLLWVSEEPLCGGKGKVNKVDFGVGPLSPNDMDGGDYCAPIVQDGKVYLYYVGPDYSRIQNDPKLATDIEHIRGAPFGSVALGHFVHRFMCSDARTGKTLWRKDIPVFLRDGFKGEKQGVAQTPCIVGDILVARMGGAVMGLNPANGEQLWNNPKVGSSGGYWSHENSVVGIGGVAVMGVDDGTCSGLVGLDPTTGKELWRLKRVRGYLQIPSQVILEGQPYILCALSATDKSTPTEQDQLLSLIEPKTGKIIWQDKRIGENPNSLVVSGDIVAGNVLDVANLQKFEKGDRWTGARVGALRISLKGAEPLWTNDQINYYGMRCTPVATNDRVIIDSRATGFAALDLTTGAIKGKDRHIYDISGGDHNWTWHIATDNIVVTSGLLLFTLRPEMKKQEGQLRIPAAQGYWCPVKPAIVDGRLFLRTTYHLLCYDLRKP